jgi:hypothetical protein
MTNVHIKVELGHGRKEKAAHTARAQPQGQSSFLINYLVSGNYWLKTCCFNRSGNLTTDWKVI